MIETGPLRTCRGLLALVILLGACASARGYRAERACGYAASRVEGASGNGVLMTGRGVRENGSVAIFITIFNTADSDLVVDPDHFVLEAPDTFANDFVGTALPRVKSLPPFRCRGRGGNPRVVLAAHEHCRIEGRFEHPDSAYEEIQASFGGVQRQGKTLRLAFILESFCPDRCVLDPTAKARR